MRMNQEWSLASSSTKSKLLGDMIEVMRTVFPEIEQDEPELQESDCLLLVIVSPRVIAFQLNAIQWTHEWGASGRHCSKSDGGGIKGLETKRKAETENPVG